MINLDIPERIAISEGISNATDHLLFNPLMEFIRKLVPPPVSNKVKIVKSVLGYDASLIGIAMMFLSQQ